MRAVVAAFIALMVGTVDYASANESSSVLERVQALAAEGDYAEALLLIHEQKPTIEDPFVLSLWEARIRAWSGDHAGAERIIAYLEEQAPEDPDLGVTRGHVARTRGDLLGARSAFERVLASFPDYPDALQGQSLVERQMVDRPDIGEPAFRVRLDYGGSISRFGRSATKDWGSGFAQVSSIYGKLRPLALVEYHRRFEREDLTLLAGVTAPIGDKAYFSVTAGGTVEADFRPRRSLRVDSGRYFDAGGKSLAISEFGFRLTADEYPVGTITVSVPRIGLALGQQVDLMVSSYIVDQPAEKTTVGMGVQTQTRVGGGNFLHLGCADAPETVSGAVVRTRSMNIGLSRLFSDRHRLRIDFSREDRDNSFVRSTLSVGITHRY